jgi:hypothetical protein
MRRKNDKIIVFGMIAIGILAMTVIVALLGLGAYVYTNEKPAPTPTPASTAVPVATATPVTDLNKTFDVRKVLSDEAGRTYTLYIELKPDATPIDMSRLAVQVVADGKTYNVWDFYHGEHGWTGNGDVILNEDESFTLTLYMPQADVPLHTDSLIKIVLLVDGQTAYSLNAPAV